MTLSAHPRPGLRDVVDDLLDAMTLDEKLSFVHGATDPESLGSAGYVPGVPRLGVPPLRLTDGPAGVRVTHPATAMPAPIALASTFDPALARRYGEVIGRDGRALGQDVLLSPMVNVIRVPTAGRNFETFSEDPLVSARMVAEEIRGIQDQGLMATVKHLAANNQEQDRMTVDARVGDQALHEIELPGFEAAVEAGAASVMGSYNKVNGEYGCGSTALLTTLLRERWDFRGWVMSDWFATHSTDDLVAGLDQEMPGGQFLGEPLKDRDRGRHGAGRGARRRRAADPRADGGVRPAGVRLGDRPGRRRQPAAAAGARHRGRRRRRAAGRRGRRRPAEEHRHPAADRRGRDEHRGGRDAGELAGRRRRGQLAGDAVHADEPAGLDPRARRHATPR